MVTVVAVEASTGAAVGDVRLACPQAVRDKRVAEGREAVSSVEKKIGLFQRGSQRYRA